MPPKCFFPEAKDFRDRDLRRGLITVPSCRRHNTSRSKDDEYAMAVTVAHVATNAVARRHFASKVVRALSRSHAFASSVFSNPRGVRVRGQPSVAVDVDLDRFYGVMESICCALAFRDLRRKLLENQVVWAPAFRHSHLDSDSEGMAHAFRARLLLKASAWRGANPSVFRYQVFDSPGRITVFRLSFYEGFDVYAVAGLRSRGRAA